MESQADKLAFDYAVAAGYNVGAGAALWQHILEQNGSKSSGFAELFNDHPTSVSRRDNYNKKITEWSKNQVNVNKETGLITVAGKPFYTPAKTTNMSPQEQAFLIAGNLSAVFHDGGQHDAVWTNSENTLLVGEQPVMSFDGVADSDAVEKRLRDILSSSNVRTVVAEEIKDDNNSKRSTAKVKAEQKQESAAETKPMTMRQKLEAFKAQQ